MTAGGEDPRLIQIRTEGKIDRLGDKFDRFQADVIDIRGRVDRHANDLMVMRGQIKSHEDHPQRITALETHRTLQEGERKGVALSGKLILMLCGAVPVGLGAMLLRALGA